MTEIGIDLGTTNSLAAVFDGDAPRLIPNAQGAFLTPSVVGLSDGDALLTGEAARRRLLTHPGRTIARFKRHMGTEKSFALGKTKQRAEDLSAMILRALKADAEAHLGQPVEAAVISVPAYFNNQQRQATAAAAAMAELKVTRLVNEPTAAALAYGLQDREGESTFLVFDLGGGTFDVTILEMFDGVMEVRSSAGDAFLGGEDFTDALADDLAVQAGGSLRKADAETRARLREAADRMKRQLTTEHEAGLSLELGGRTHDLRMDRARFEEVTAELVARLRKPIQRCLYDSGLNPEDLDRVVLVGGATRMAMTPQLVARLLRRLPERTIDPDHVVALGAAVQAGLAAKNAALSDMVMTDVSAFTLGVRTATRMEGGRVYDDRFTPIIERNTPVPVSRVERFNTMEKNQKNMKVSVYQGEAPKASDNLLLGEIDVTVPKGEAGEQQIDIRFTYDVSGLLEVDATVLSLDRTDTLVIANGAETLSEAEIAEKRKALAALKTHPRDDERNVATLARLEEAYAMLLGGDREQVGYRLEAFRDVLERQDVAASEAMRTELDAWLDALEDGYVS